MKYKLPAQHKLFCEQYIKCKGNGTKAAIAAGYSKKTARSKASQLLTKVNLLEYINKLQNKVSEKILIETEWIMNELIENHKSARKNRQYAASNQALIALGKHIGMWKEKKELDVSIIDPVKAKEAIERIFE